MQDDTDADTKAQEQHVTWRALLLGLILSALLAGVNCWMATVANAHFLGGVQMPFGSIFALLFLIIAVQLPLRLILKRTPQVARFLPQFSTVELLTIYCMLIFASLVSTPGTHNMFITFGPSLFYFSTRENGWADLFYRHVPGHFAPGWNGTRYQKEVIDPLFLGNVAPGDIPWHAWMLMLTAWTTMLLLSYAMLFFLALIFRKQWTEHEALSFPLLQVPMQMAEVEQSGSRQHGESFWSNRGLWMGFGLAAFVHFFKGMNAQYPDWPKFPLQEAITMSFTEHPWNAIGNIGAEVHLGGIGLAYLLPREISLSFWFFFFFQKSQLVACTVLGFPELVFRKDTFQGQPTFLTFQSIGGWLAMAGILLWSGRTYLRRLCREAFGANRVSEGDPFSPRFVLAGFVVTFAGLVVWCLVSGISLWFAASFIGLYIVTSLVLTRIVAESGYVFSQLTFSPMEWLTSGMFGAAAIGAADLTRASFMNAVLMRDARANVMAAFLHTLKIATELRLNRREVRRLIAGVAAAIVVTLLVTIYVSLVELYGRGALGVYDFYHKGPINVLKGTFTMLTDQPTVRPDNLAWMAAGGGFVWLIALAHNRLLWFPLHPIGFLMATGGPMARWWFSYFVGWAIKSLILKFGGSDTYLLARPFMIGLILGNVASMVFWMLFGLRSGTQIPYWPA